MSVLEEQNKEWIEMSEERKEECFRYLTLMKRLISNPKLLGIKHKKWMLENCDLPTDAIPYELLVEKKLLL